MLLNQKKTACPDNCRRCYFDFTLDLKPRCYPSQCKVTFGLNDEDGTCFSCPPGCDYCVKKSGLIKCILCSNGYGPNYELSGEIKTCVQCSLVDNCEICEMVDNNIQCKKSFCTNGKRYAYLKKDCSENDPSNFHTSINPCTGGQILVLKGLDAGKCKSCSVSCSDCQLNSAKNDVECNTCTSNLPNCMHCLQTSGPCTKCKSNYVLNKNGQCIQCPTSPTLCQDCRVDSNDPSKSVCLSYGCQKNSALRDIDFKCETCGISNCELCTKDAADTFQCLTCNNYYFLDKSGECKPCVANCLYCRDENTCLQNGCKEGYTRHKTQGNCISCPGAGVAGCEYENSTSNIYVTSCKKGYRLNIAGPVNLCESLLT